MSRTWSQLTPDQKDNLCFYIEALESKELPQCEGTFIEGNQSKPLQVCSIGMGIAINDGLEVRNENSEYNFYWWYFQNGGIYGNDGIGVNPYENFERVYGLDQSLISDLLNMNDTWHFTFPEVAAVIRHRMKVPSWV